MTKAFAWLMLAFSIGMLFLQLWVAASPNLPVVAFWAVILFLSVYVLFFKKPKEKASK